MKRFLLFIVFVTVTMFSQAQVFELYTQDQQLFTPGDTLYMNGTVSDDLLAAHMTIKNISGTVQSVYARKDYVYVVPGTINAFCWAGACYTSLASPNYSDIDPGTTNDEFSTEYMPQGVSGISVIRYTFFTTAGDSFKFFVKYNIFTTGIGSASAGISVSNPFPNPARENLNFMVGAIQDAVTIEIHDLTGKMVKAVKVNQSGLVQIPVAELRSGIYFAEVISGDRTIKTHKIVVR